MTSIPELVSTLTAASKAYYNGPKPLMDDEAFDALLEQLRSKDPKNPFLSTVGAPPEEGAVLLPALMPSLEKIKPGQSNLPRFLRLTKTYVLSEKLDGLSALWCPRLPSSLYLRGNGETGQTISHIIPTINGLVPSTQDWIIRGELVLPKNTPGLGTTPARTVINGLVHKSDPDKTLLGRVNFVAYEVIQPPGLKRSDQFEWLRSNGFMTAWWTMKDAPTEENLKTYFTDRRAASQYDTDGIVVGLDQAAHKPSLKPPKDCVAFKMPVSDQSATTTVEEVLWAPSAQGYLIPRIRIKPVQIGGAVIEFCTGHNARTIVDKQIGPGATIRIRRSGDVIPTLEHVSVPANPSMPSSYQWEWNGPDSTATHIKLVGVSVAQQAAELHLFAKTIDIPGLGPANCKALVEAGLLGPAALWSQSAEQLSTILGPKTGATLYANLRKHLFDPALTETTLLVASNTLPRSVGESKLKALFAVEPDCKKWSALTVVPPGWTQESLSNFQTSFPAYEAWRAKELHFLPYPLLGVKAQTVTKSVCFTGFRDKALEAKLADRFTISQTVTSKLTCLVVPDGPDLDSEKVKKARALGIEILQCSEFSKKYLS